MNKFVVGFLFFCGARSLGKIDPPTEEITPEMKWYINRTTVTLSKIYDTVGLMGYFRGYTGAMLSYLLQYKNTDAVVIADRRSAFIQHKFFEKTRNLFCFVETTQHFGVMLDFIIDTPFFKLNGFIQFVLGEIVTDKSWLWNSLKLIWSKNVLNYAIVFQIGTTIEVIGYNPFEDSYINLTNHKLGASIYPNKLVNMHKHVWNVATALEPPRNVFINGKIVGHDILRIKEIGRRLNATVNITVYTDPESVSRAVRDKKVDFSVYRFFTMVNSTKVQQPSYPICMDYLVILTPSSDLIPQYKYLFTTFDTPVWLVLILLCIFMTVAFYFVAKFTKFRYVSTAEATLAMLQILLSNPYSHVSHAKSFLRTLLINWSFFSLLISIAFNSALKGSLLTFKYAPEINTYEELQKSNLSVYVNSRTFKSVLKEFEPIRSQLVYMNETNAITKKILDGEKDAAYITLGTNALILTKSRDFRGRPLFRLLPHIFVAGLSVYNFPYDSPYNTKLDELFLLYEQYGLSEFGFREIQDGGSTNPDTLLAVDHLQGVFIFFVLGLLTSALVFSVELVVFNGEYLLECASNFCERLVWSVRLVCAGIYNKIIFFLKSL